MPRRKSIRRTLTITTVKCAVVNKQEEALDEATFELVGNYQRQAALLKAASSMCSNGWEAVAVIHVETRQAVFEMSEPMFANYGTEIKTKETENNGN